MSDVSKISQLIDNNLNIINNISSVSKEHILSTIIMIVKYSNDLFENKMKKDTQSFRYNILKNYEIDQDKSLFRIFLYFLINKYSNLFATIAYTKEIHEFLMNRIDNYKISLRNLHKPFTSISNKSGLNLFEINRLLYKLCNVKLTTTTKNIYQVLNEMYDIENGKSEYGLFRYSIIGNNYCTHCNIFLYHRTNNIWIRIEPAGMYFCDGDDPSFIKEQYNDTDNIIKELKTNYLSFNDYHYLPGLHFINPGPYCTYYSVMIVDEYINDNNHNIFSVVEKVSSIDYIDKKLKQYESILKI
jgi:hypothetical protein